MAEMPRETSRRQRLNHRLHHPVARKQGRRTLRRWTGVGILGVVGLTAACAGLAYQTSSDQEAAQARVKAKVLAQYQHRRAIDDANLAIVHNEQLTMAHALSRELALAASRRKTRAQAMAALQLAQAAQARAPARSAPARLASVRTATTVAKPTVRRGEDGAAATSGGS
jgi:hypothetical protein